MSKHFNQDNMVWFVLLPERQYAKDQNGNTINGFGQMSFTTYTDKVGIFGNPGRGVKYVQSRGDDGRDNGKNFTFSQSKNAFICRAEDKDVYGKSMVDFLKNHPNCQGSPNGNYRGSLQLDVVFKLLDTEGDAEVALEAKRNMARALDSVLKLDPQTLAEVASIGIAYHGTPNSIMLHRVSEWAEKRPLDYFNILNSGDRFLRAIIRKAVKEGVIQVRGTLHYWGEELLGGSEDAAIAYITNHPDAEQALREAVDLTAPIVEAKNKVGRPRKNKD